MNAPPVRLRSLLFAPASKPEVLRKMPRSAPDGVAQAEPAAAGGAGEPLEQALAHQTTR